MSKTYEQALSDYDKDFEDYNNKMDKLYNAYDGPIPPNQLPQKPAFPNPKDYAGDATATAMVPLMPLMNHLKGMLK